jgi:signal transduction histidine kinase
MQRWYTDLAKQYAKVQLFYNPLLTGAAVLALAPLSTFWSAFPVALLVASVASSVCFVPVVIALAIERRPRPSGPVRLRRRAWYLGLALLAMPVGLLLASTVTELVLGVRSPATAYDYRFGAFLGVLIAGLFFLWQTLADARAAALAAELRRKHAEAQQLQAQLSALTAQLNPHFMFNALNAIAALVHTDAAVAERTVLRLSELYRGIVAATRRDRHTLGDELDICRAYLDVEHARFSDRLRVHVDVAPDLDPQSVTVPVLVLQPLVENAVTHGLSDRANGGSVWLRARATERDLELEVADDGVGYGGSSRKGSGLGIESIRKRLKLCYGDRASLELSSPAASSPAVSGPAVSGPESGARAVIRLPRS